MADTGTVASDALSEWGISFSGGAMVIGAPVSGFTYLSMVEDTSDTANHNLLLGPNHGGQDYDGEFLGVGIDDGRLVIAIVTGQRPDNGKNFFSPGDIRITTSAGIFGVEVGGGKGGTSNSGAITEGAGGSTYSLNPDGTTKGGLNTASSTSPLAVTPWGDTAGSVQLTNADGTLGGSGSISIASNQYAGSIWLNSKWIVDPIFSGSNPTDPNNPASAVQLQFVSGTGTRLAELADFYYSRDAINNQHAVIEVAIDLALFNGGSIGKVEWAPSCGNDLLFVQPLTALSTPEPASWLLMSCGGICAFVLRRRQMSRSLSA